MAMFHTNVLDNQIKALPTVDTASGSGASFDTDLTENLIEVVCDIQYSQASGTPSPSNPLPITVYNALNLAHIGNTDKMSWLQGVTSGRYGFVDLGMVSWTRKTDGAIPYFRHDFTDSSLTQLNRAFVCSDYPNVPFSDIYTNGQDKSSASYSGGIFIISDNDYSDATTFQTAMSGVYLIYELSTPTTPTYTASDFNAMLTAFGIDGSLYNIPFGQTVAKGTLNVTTGVLEITHILYDLATYTGVISQSGGIQIGQRYFRFDTYAPEDLPALDSVVCEKFENVTIVSSNKNVGICIGKSSALDYNTIFFRPENPDNYTPANIMNYISSLGTLKLVYKLATPTTIQLSATQVTALLNENNIWCDTNGDTSVKYILSVGKAIS